MTPTPEQATIVTAVTTTSDNLLISALAGAAKTSTLVLIAQALGTLPILSLAFNKKIALEMTDRLPSTCVAMTLNSIGHRAWANSTGKKLILDTGKTYRIVKDIVEALTPEEKKLAYSLFPDLIRAVDTGKTLGYIPDGKYPNAKRLHDDESFFAELDDEPSALEESIIREATLQSLKEGFSGKIDFNDQILLPTVFPASFPQYPLVLIDEAQDLSALNHATLAKIAKKRVIAVGDECQSIYGFRGAHQNSMALLETQFKMKRMALTVSFRCPIDVVKGSRWRAPHMQYPAWAKPGQVTVWKNWSLDMLPTDDVAVLCRNNAPLFSLAVKLLKSGRYPQLVGNDIGKSLLKILSKFGKPNLHHDEVIKKIDEWTKEKIKKARNPSRVYDQAECLKIFADQGENLGDAMAYGEALLAQSGPVKLMTVHKSKGLEFDNVFILDRFLIKTAGGDGYVVPPPFVEDQQEANLLYVAQTRAKLHLTYIETKQLPED